MSDHEEFGDIRYSTPVPELDDHRHQEVSVQRVDRTRRGTADTLYGTTTKEAFIADLSQFDQGCSQSNALGFEEVVIDGAFLGVPSNKNRSRRHTAISADSRAASPPNSVKAFAEARRNEECSMHRTASANSRRSHRSRHYVNNGDVTSQAASTPSVEEDVCFPQQNPDEKRDKRKLYIDFDYLERFMAEEERDRTPPKNQPQARVFNDLQASKYGRHWGTASSESQIVQTDSDSTSLKEHGELDEKFGISHQHSDPNRFSFFSSAWESTIHAAEFGDLIMPGESIRGLFTLPETEQDGVWWLNMSNPTEEEIRAICKAFGIHPLTIEDIEKQEAREKIELFPAYYFACFRSFHVLEVDGVQELEPFNIYVIVFREGTLSFSFAPNPHATQVRKRITALKDYVALSSDWICYALM
jgi:magnesium transporter